MTIKAVLWDMDGTLIDSEPTALTALTNALNVAGLSVSDRQLDSFIGMAADDIYAQLKSTNKLQMARGDWEQLKYDGYIAQLGKVAPFPDALKTWHALVSRGIQQAIVTNSDRIITDANLRHIGLAQPGLTTVTRNDVIRGKPNPEPYLRAAMLFGRLPEECLVVEDSQSGQHSGIAAGMPVAVVPHGDPINSSQILRLERVQHLLDIVG